MENKYLSKIEGKGGAGMKYSSWRVLNERGGKIAGFFILLLIGIILLSFSFVTAKSFIVGNASDASQTYFIVNGTNGYVGIGTASSTYLLDVRGNVAFNNSLFLTNAGNVGIGTSAPSHKFNVLGTFNATGLSYFASNISIGGFQINNLGTPSLSTDAATKAYVDSVTGGGNAVWSLAGNVAYLNDTSDRVSIGGTTSTYKLDVNGNVSLNNSLFVTNAGNVGVGTASPQSALTVSGTISSIGNNLGNINMRYHRNVAQYANSRSTVSGTIQIGLPKSNPNTMLSIKINGYSYTSNGAWEVIIGGYPYQTGQWYNTNVELRGRPPFNLVRLAHNGTNNVILLGNTSSSWSYPQIAVTEVLAGYGNTDGWGVNWTIINTTDESNIVNVTTPTVYQYTDTNGNLGIGTITPTQKLDISGSVNVSTDIYIGAATVKQWLYNQTSPLMQWNYNQTLPLMKWNYNQTAPAQLYSDVNLTAYTYSKSQSDVNLTAYTYSKSQSDANYSAKIWSYNQTSPLMQWNYNQTATSGWNISGTNLFTRSLSYNVGIGTTSPVEKLDVIGSVRANHFELSENYTGGINDLDGGTDIASSIFNGYANTYQHAPIYVIEFWNGTSSAWENWTNSGVENLFDGRPETVFAVTDKKKFRIVIGPVATWMSNGLLGVWHYWTSTGTQKYNLTIETSTSNTGPWGALGNKSMTASGVYQSFWQISDHSPNNTKRLTFDYSADTGNSTLREIGFFSQYVSPTYGYKGLPFYWDYYKKITLGGNLSVGGFQITNLGTPSLSTDAATKNYVDSAISGVNGSSSAADDWNLSGTNLFPKSLSYNVGIGTTTPTYNLQVAGNVSLNNSLFVTNAGNVGIGIANPTQKLDVNGSLIMGSNTGSGNLTIRSEYLSSGFTGNDGKLAFNYNTLDRIKLVSDQISAASDDFDLRFQFLNNSATGYNDWMYIDGTNGNVGIGTTTPLQKLDVSGSVNVSTDIYIGAATVKKWLYNQTAPAQLYSDINLTAYTYSKSQSDTNLTAYTYSKSQSDTNLTAYTYSKSQSDANYSAKIWNYNQTSPLMQWNYNQSTWNISGTNFFPESLGFNVGIGTVSPNDVLEVVGNIRAEAGTNTGDLFFTDGLAYASNRSTAISGLAGLKGRLVNYNPDFSQGTYQYARYDNNATLPDPVLTIMDDTTSPSPAGKILNISYDGTGPGSGSNPTPGFGGFNIQVTKCTAQANDDCYIEGNRYVYRIWARIPSGRSINWASNSYGNGSSYKWISNQSGTDNWQQYIAVQKIGLGAPFSSTGFWYISGGTNTAFDWQVASFEMIGVDEPATVEQTKSLNVGLKLNVNLTGGNLLSTTSTYLATDSGSVGVGTATPTQKLDVRGIVNVSAEIYVKNVTAVSPWLYNQTSPLMQWNYNQSTWNISGTNFFPESLSYNVGIGTTSPTNTLNVVGTLNITGLSYHSANLSIGGFQINNLGTPSLSTDAATKNYVDTLITGVNGTTSLADDWNLSGTNLFPKSLSYNVGIGTTSPGYKFDVNGDAIRINYTSPILYLSDSNGGSDRPGIVFNNNNLAYLAGDELPLATQTYSFMSKFASNRSYNTALRIYGNSSGTDNWGIYLQLSHDGLDGVISTDTGDLILSPASNVGIGTASPTQKLEVSGSVNVSTDIYIGAATVKKWLYNQTAPAQLYSDVNLTAYTYSKSQSDANLTAYTYSKSQSDANYSAKIWSYNQTSPLMQWNYNQTATSGWNISGTNLFTRSLSYNVGIGTTSPTALLHISQSASPEEIAVRTDALYEDVGGVVGANIIPSNSWILGNGSVGIFSMNGGTNENVREYGSGPHGNSVILWKGLPDGSSGQADGGWDTNYFTIDPNETYRFTVWIKKTGSLSPGSAYLGTREGLNNIFQLNGTSEGNPYFWCGSLPALNKWYLLVGYIHSNLSNNNQSYGGIYDGITGAKVVSLAGTNASSSNCNTDFRWAANSATARHRAYMYYSNLTTDSQFFWDPRVEVINGRELTLEALLGISKSATSAYQAYFGGNVGIGTTTPTYNLQVAGNVSLNNSFFVTNAGNVGVGTATPTQKLDVRGIVNVSAEIYVKNVTAVSPWLYNQTSPLMQWAYNQSTWNISGTNFFPESLSYNVGIGTTAPTNTLNVVGGANITTNLTVAANLFVNASNVGIGTSGPFKTALTINGSTTTQVGIFIDNTNAYAYSVLRLNSRGRDDAIGFAAHSFGASYGGVGAYTANTSNIAGFDSGGLSILANNESGAIKFYTGGNNFTNERMRIDNTGKIGIGTTTPTQLLDVRGIVNVSAEIYVKNVTAVSPWLYNQTSPLMQWNYNQTLPLMQWNYNQSNWNVSGTNIFPSSLGFNVGIGTASPTTALDMGSGSAGRMISWGGIRGVCSSYSQGALSLLTGFRCNTTDDQYVIGGTGTWTRAGIRVGDLTNGGDISIFTDSQQLRNDGDGIDYTTMIKMVIKNNGNVGIRTTTPTYNLQVAGNVSLNNSLFVTNAGNVGIGTASPTQKLDISGSVNVSTDIYIGAATVKKWLYNQTAPAQLYSDINLTAYTYSKSQSDANYSAKIWSYNQTSPLMQWNYNQSTWNISGTNFFPESLGFNVGIGTTSPGYKLEVNNTLAAKGVAPTINLYAISGSAPMLTFGMVNQVSAAIEFNQNVANALEFMVGGIAGTNSSMIILTSGNVGIKTTTPAEKLEVNGNVRINDTINVATGKDLIINATTGSGNVVIII